jgi:hypothetical protein
MDVAYREVRDRVQRARVLFPSDADRVYIRKEDASGIPVAVIGFAIDPGLTDYYTLIKKTIVQRLERIDGRGQRQDRRLGGEGNPDRGGPATGRGDRAEPLPAWSRSWVPTTSPWPAECPGLRPEATCSGRWRSIRRWKN